MLQIIWDGIRSEFGLAYCAINIGTLDPILYMLPNVTFATTTHNVASYVKSYADKANKAIDKWMKIYRAKLGNS
jgi:hypothetical protein